MLLAAVERVALLALPAFDGLANGFGALRRVLPVLPLRIALRPRARDGQRLLFQRVVQPSQKHLVVASGGAAPAASTPRVTASVASLTLSFAHRSAVIRPVILVAVCIGAVV